MAEPQHETSPPKPEPSHTPTRVMSPAEADRRQRGIILRMVRGAFVVLILTVTLLNILIFGEDVTPGLMFDLASYWWITLIASISLAALFLAIDLLTPNKKLYTFGGIIFGLVAGLIVTVAIGFVVDLVATSWDFGKNAEIVNSIKVLLGISLTYLGISTVLQTQDDFRLVIPYVEFAKQLRGQRPLLLDSSAIIDARIADVGETGLIQTPIVIPFFVVNELQVLADSSDKLKRAKGRRGLDVIARLQRNAKLDVTVDESPMPGKAVDQMIVELAREMQGMIVTSDIALARIAGFRNIPVLNINDLANALKPALVPGDTLTIHLMKPGEQPGQAVGYLEDGTMVVAEDGEGAIGQEVMLTVRSSLQTTAGRMIFGRIGNEKPDPAGAASGSDSPVSDSDEVGEKAERTQEAAADPGGQPRPGPFPPNPPVKPKHPRSPRR